MTFVYALEPQTDYFPLIIPTQKQLDVQDYQDLQDKIFSQNLEKEIELPETIKILEKSLQSIPLVLPQEIVLPPSLPKTGAS